MPLKRFPNVVVAAVMFAATLGVFGPHLLMLGYKVVGARPPSALVFFCVLNHGHAGHRPTGTPTTLGWNPSPGTASR